MGVSGRDDAHAAGGFLHDEREDEAGVDVGSFADGKDLVVQDGHFVRGVVGDAPGFAADEDGGAVD